VVVSEAGPSTTPVSFAVPSCYVLVPPWKLPTKSALGSTPLLSEYQLAYHTDGFIICTLCKSAVPWNYLQAHLKTEWILQPMYFPGAETAHDIISWKEFGGLCSKRDQSCEIPPSILLKHGPRYQGPRRV
jgi:hypothetical protein